VVQLYRTISKEMPRVLTIYDADLSPQDVRAVACGVVEICLSESIVPRSHSLLLLTAS
jgi:hypothetical protein